MAGAARADEGANQAIRHARALVLGEHAEGRAVGLTVADEREQVAHDLAVGDGDEAAAGEELAAEADVIGSEDGFSVLAELLWQHRLNVTTLGAPTTSGLATPAHCAMSPLVQAR